ncbi:MAG: hypothetical protein JSV45_06405 [Chromatiales bacterium]|nr:MAG: hypothetical protein JSV45_06405 [Chromatiales bacterium]
MDAAKSDTHQKALDINLDPGIYGTIAEIGAGQEVAAWFFKVGGAAGTVAKTISAYDMKVSDEIYGKAGRYVSRERAQAMIEREFRLLQDRLSDDRPDTRFFAFANTVAARNYQGTNECHGWLGLRFQDKVGGESNDVILHVNMLDQTNVRQQRAMGILGVNLIHAAMHAIGSLDIFLTSLFAELSLSRLEIDLLHMSGPDVPAEDDLEVGLQLVRRDLAQAVCLSDEGRMEPPTEVIRKRPVAIARGLYREPEHVHPEMLQAGIRCVATETGPDEREPLGLMELSVNNVSEGADVPDSDYLGRIASLLDHGFPVLLTRLRESYSVTEYLRRYSDAPLRYNLGVSSLALTFAEDYYADLPGGLLEATGKLFAHDVKAYGHAMDAGAFREHLQTASVPVDHVCEPRSDTVNVDNLELLPPVGRLYRYLVEAGYIENIC